MFSGRHTGPFHLTYRWFLTLPFVGLQVRSKTISKRDQEAIIHSQVQPMLCKQQVCTATASESTVWLARAPCWGGSWVALGEPYDRLVLFRMSVAVKTDTSLVNGKLHVLNVLNKNICNLL